MGAFNPSAFSSAAFDAGAAAPTTSKFTFLPDSLRIVVNPEVLSFTTLEVYSAWKLWATTHLNYAQAFRVVGGDPLGSGLSVASYFFLLNGWRIRPAEGSHNLLITGNLFADGGDIPVVSTLGQYQVNVNYTVSVQAQGISTSGGTAPSSEEVATAVWSKMLEGISAESMMRIMLSALAGRREGLGTSTERFMAQDGVTPRITFLPDSNGNGAPTLNGAL